MAHLTINIYILEFIGEEQVIVHTAYGECVQV